MRNSAPAFALLVLILLLVAGWVGFRTGFFGGNRDRPAVVAGKAGKSAGRLPGAPPTVITRSSARGNPPKARKPEEPPGGVPADRSGTKLVIIGRVTDSTEKPIAGAAIAWGRIDSMPAAEAEARTDGDGAYRIEVPAAGPTYQLTASLPGRAPSWARNVVPGTSDEPAVVDFELGDGSRLRGLVVDEQSFPVPSAEVRARTAEAGVFSSFSMVLGPMALPGESYRTLTGPDGTFGFENLPEENVHLDVEKDGFDGRSATVPVGPEARITIRRRNGAVRARVVDAESGAPIGEFAIRGVDHAWPFSAPDGRFEIGPFLPGNRSTLEVVADGYSMDSFSCITRRPEDSTEAEIRLHRGTPFRAMLIDGRTGGPLAGAAIIAGILPTGAGIDWAELNGYSTWRGPLRNVLRLKTDASGMLELREVDPILTIFILIPGLERRIIRPEERPPPGPDQLRRMELRPEASIAGECAPVPPGGTTARLWKVAGQGEVEATFEPAPLDAAGRYRWGSLQPGAYLVTIPGLTRRVAVSPEVETRVIPGESLGSITIGGRSEPWTEITLSPRFEWDCQDLQAAADHTGRFRIAGLKEGIYTVRTFGQSVGPGGINIQRKSLEIEVDGDGEFDLTGF